MRHLFNTLLLLGLSSLGAAVFKDEVGDIDFHHALLGVPQPDTTFFHRPRKEDKASLLYTFGDVGVFGALNPSNGAVVWRHQIDANSTDGVGHLRAPEGEDWVAAAYGSSVQSWNALTGRNVWHSEFQGEVKDLEIMEVTETGRKDVLVLFDEGDVTVLRRLHGTLGTVVWEFREHSKDLPLQVSTNIENVYVISLHGSLLTYSLKITALDVATGARVNDWTVGTKDVNGPSDVMFVGANSASPILAWADTSLSKLNIHVLGAKGKQEIPLASNTISVTVHAPHQTQSQPHFLVHTKSSSGNRAEVYHTNLKSGQITKAYELPHLKADSAFSVSSEGANVYFTRVTEDDVHIVSSDSPAVLQRWLLKREDTMRPVHAVSEVIKKPGGENSFAVRSAAVTSDENWVLVRNGEMDWVRPEGLSGAVGAVWADIPEPENLAKVLEQEAHTNPISAYTHRIARHISELQYLPGWVASVPGRLTTSILGGGSAPKSSSLERDAFGFNKIIVLATRRGRFYGINTGNAGAVVWSQKRFPQPAGESFDVKGMLFKDGVRPTVEIRGSKGEYALIDVSTGGGLVSAGAEGVVIASTAVFEGTAGPELLSLGPGGKLDQTFTPEQAPKDTVVIRGDNSVKGVKFVADGKTVARQEIWQLQILPGHRIVDIATRPSHDPVASIGRVLGDRRVNYKYLNANTIVVAIYEDESSTLSVQTVDTISGEILATQRYHGVDGSKTVSCVVAENWHTCAFFGQYNLKDGTNRLVKGYQMVSTDLYESETPNDRGPLEAAANFSALDPVDTPRGPALPWVVTQSWVVGQPLDKLAVTQTAQGITNRQILAYLPESRGIVGLPRQAVDPRRPVGRDPTAAEMEAEGLQKYFAGLDIDARSIVSHERDVIGVEGIVATPAIVESTSLVFTYGIDVFGTRVAPSGVFDILGQGFNKATLILTVVALFGGVMFLSPMVSGSLRFLYHVSCANYSQVRKKQINRRWEALM